MKILKSLSVLLTALLFGANAYAQSNGQAYSEAAKLGYEPYPYGFIQLQGGLGVTPTGVKLTDLIEPTFSVGAGCQFTPIVGARLHVNGLQSKGGLRVAPAGKVMDYKFKYINTNADVMVNVLNIFRGKVHQVFDLYLIGGIGVNYAWDNSKFEKIAGSNEVLNSVPNAWGKTMTPRKNLLGHNIRAGILADVNLGKHWGVGVEVDANSLDDRFNSKYSNSDDWMFTAQVSLTYKFGHMKPRPIDLSSLSTLQGFNENRGAEVAHAKDQEVKEKPVAKPEPVAPATNQMEIFFGINEYDNLSAADSKRVKEFAEWLKQHPKAKATVTGYADKGTGTAKVNLNISKRRANKIADLLKDEGVDGGQIDVEYKGDTVQPYSDNDKNRVVITVASE